MNMCHAAQIEWTAVMDVVKKKNNFHIFFQPFRKAFPRTVYHVYLSLSDFRLSCRNNECTIMGHVQMINYNNPSWLYLILNFHESVRYKTEVPP